MGLSELKTQVATGAYKVDERLVAEALMKRLGIKRFDVLPPVLSGGVRSQPAQSIQRP